MGEMNAAMKAQLTSSKQPGVAVGAEQAQRQRAIGWVKPDGLLAPGGGQKAQRRSAPASPPANHPADQRQQAA